MGKGNMTLLVNITFPCLLVYGGATKVSNHTKVFTEYANDGKKGEC